MVLCALVRLDFPFRRERFRFSQVRFRFRCVRCSVLDDVQPCVTTMAIAALVALALVGLALAVLLYRKFANALYYGAKIGGPRGYPLIGNALLFLYKSPPGKDVLGGFIKKGII